jgi:hypothetical protein
LSGPFARASGAIDVGHVPRAAAGAYYPIAV